MPQLFVIGFVVGAGYWTGITVVEKLNDKIPEFVDWVLEKKTERNVVEVPTIKFE